MARQQYDSYTEGGLYDRAYLPAPTMDSLSFHTDDQGSETGLRRAYYNQPNSGSGRSTVEKRPSRSFSLSPKPSERLSNAPKKKQIKRQLVVISFLLNKITKG